MATVEFESESNTNFSKWRSSGSEMDLFSVQLSKKPKGERRQEPEQKKSQVRPQTKEMDARLYLFGPGGCRRGSPRELSIARVGDQQQNMLLCSNTTHGTKIKWAVCTTDNTLEIDKCTSVIFKLLSNNKSLICESYEISWHYFI